MIILDTETGDPDDIMVVAYLAYKGLHAVTLNPGTDEQVGLVNSVLRGMGVLVAGDIVVGGNRVVKERSCVSEFYSKVYDFKPEEPDGVAKELIQYYLDKGAKILTCGLPKNMDGLKVKDWWAQGGFAGDSVMGNRPILEKFKGMETCQSFNFSNRRLIERCITNSEQRHFISKNICHGAIYDKTKTAKNSTIKRIMDIYLQKHDGKAFHDLLAAWAMLNPNDVEWEEVEIYYDKNQVGSRLCKGTNTFISVGYDADKFWSSI
jgi:pyrimidine-specific ribonucleoside hydrolase